MASPTIHRLPWYVVAFAALFAVALLAWEYTHGGVPSHHLLDRSDLPAVSNWWGLVLLPVLGWLASWSVLRRVVADPKALTKASAAVLGALLVGVALSIAFFSGHDQVSNWIFFAALLSGLVLPTYRAEYVFGFVLGMAFAFGAVLPTIAALIGVGISALFKLLLWPAFAWTVRRVRT